MTSYQLEQRVAATVGSFWLFPHSQLYAEPRKLTDAGLLLETVETGGRKRRTYELTDAGQDTLRRATAASDEAERALLAPLSPQAAQQLRDSLQAIALC